MQSRLNNLDTVFFSLHRFCVFLSRTVDSVNSMPFIQPEARAVAPYCFYSFLIKLAALHNGPRIMTSRINECIDKRTILKLERNEKSQRNDVENTTVLFEHCAVQDQKIHFNSKHMVLRSLFQKPDEFFSSQPEFGLNDKFCIAMNCLRPID